MKVLSVLFLLCCVFGGLCQYDPNIAKSVEDDMDWNVNPCDDFYKFSCGAWLNRTVIPSDKSIVTRSFTIIGDHNDEVLFNILTSPAINQKLSAFYDSCLDLEGINKIGAQPVTVLFQLVDTTVVDITSLMTLVGTLQLSGVSPFFNFGPIIDPENPSINIAQLDQGGLGLPYPELYTSNDPNDANILKKYHSYMIDMFTLMNDSDPSTTAKLALAMEYTLATFTTPQDQLMDPFTTYNPIDMTGLKNFAPNLSWSSYFDYFQSGNITVTKMSMTVPSFFSNLSAVILESENNWEPYLKWQILNGYAPLLSEPFRQKYFDFYGVVLGGQSQPEPRNITCVHSVDSNLGELLGKYFVQQSFPGQSESDAVQLLTDIIAAMRVDLDTVTWMDNTTRARGLDKLQAVTHLIGSPSNPKTYDSLAVGQNYFTNVQAATFFNIYQSFLTIGKPADPNQWGMTAPTVNAYYDPSRNQMVFPAGILQQPFFNHSYPDAMNFGGIGMVMGHELTHGFDNQGRLYNGQGKLVNWWENSTSVQFDEKVQCMIKQYSKFEIIPGVYVNGKLTQGENVADNGGIHNAFRAFSKVIGADHLDDPSIVQHLTQAELFFVAFAQGWCTKATDNHWRVSVKTDPHSPAKFRVHGPLVNLQDFSNTFNCTLGSPMNPKDKCVVW